MNTPLETVRMIGDKLIRDTPFEYRLETAPAVRTLDRMHSVDFGRTFGLGRPAVAYAWTQITVAGNRRLTLHLEHNDGCRIWLNGVVVHDLQGDRDLKLKFDERSIDMSHRVELELRAGANQLLIKSETRGSEWAVFIQPPATKGAVVPGQECHPEIGLYAVRNVDPQVAALSNWLVMGPFPNPQAGQGRLGLDTTQAPESTFEFGRMYPGLDGPVTWTIPKVEVLGNLIDPLPWGTNYHWNYHNGGVAWAMQELAAVSGDPRYRDYAARFCDFHLDGIPFVEHQVKTLHAVLSANHFIIDTPLLDFTLAPSLPFLRRLLDEHDFPNRGRYVEWIDRMIDYARSGQIRLPGHGIYTRTTPVEHTTWVDDMFMGIPFLVHASRLVTEESLRKALLDDAAAQALGFNSQVWDANERLYMHARYSGNPAKLPYWSRCNGWASWAMSEVLAELPHDHPLQPAILAHFREHCRSLRRFQDESGLWPNVLNRSDSPLEVSGTAIFVMAMARGIRHGWLDEAAFGDTVGRGWRGLSSRIDDDGTVHDICMGTMCTEDVDYYVNRPFYDNDTHGLFAVLFAGIEVHRLQARRGAAPAEVSSGNARIPASAAVRC